MKPLPQHPASAERSMPDALPPCIDRRAFLGNSSLLAVSALLAAACGDGQLGATVAGPGTLPTGSLRLTIRVADHAALATVGGIALVDATVTGSATPHPVAVLRFAASQYRAFSRVCPHQGTTIGPSSGGFECPNHGARYSSTGQVLGQPLDGGTTRALTEFTVTADLAAGTLSISN